MAKIVNIFSKQIIEESKPSVMPKHFPLLAKPVNRVTSEDLKATADFDFRGAWDVTLVSCKSLGLVSKELEKHEVTFVEVRRAASIAKWVKTDFEAREYFENLLGTMDEKNNSIIPLKSIQPEFRGYVWYLDYQILCSAGSYADTLSRSIVGRPLIRHIYF